ncbi:MAG TPA: CHAT domain-containing protein, partial [Thermoanaerobaculia bacterium]|nr:CHAT domain-containing protein [Thermoanaerobaculia bacterium]
IGAAYLARGQRQGTAADIAMAVETSSAALAADPSLTEARFNRALALEELHLSAEARRAWESYLAEETDPQWAAEAERHLRDLGETTKPPLSSARELRRAAERDDPALASLVAAHRFRARRLVEWELLPEWGAAVAAGDRARTSRALAVASSIAAVYQAQTGEDRLARQVSEARAADGAAARRLAAAHEALARGEAAVERMDSRAAREELTRAASLFPVDGIGWRRATVEVLVTAFITSGQQGGLSERVAQRAAMGGDDLYTAARLAWFQGLLAANRAETGEAIGRYLEALSAFERLGEVEPKAWIHFLLSEAYTLAGDERSTWRHRAAAVAAAPVIEDRRRSFDILLGAATWSVLGGRPWLADAYLDELTARGYASLPDDHAYLRLWRARVSLQLGERERGTSELAQAALATHALERSGVRDWLGAELAATRGANAVSPAVAVKALSRAFAGFRDFGTTARLPGLLLQRSLAHRSAGDGTASERDLREGIALLERQPRLANADEVWLTRLDGAPALYDQMMAVELGRDRDDQAFLWSERARRRALAPYAGTAGVPEPVALARVGRELDATTTLLSYAQVGEDVLVWRVDRRGSQLVRLPTSARQVSTWVGKLDADLAAGEWTTESATVARRLHRALVAPAALAAGTNRLVIVPDKGLATLPFSALLDDDGSFLVQRYTVEIAPSAAFYLHARDRWRSLADDPATALVLGDPRVDAKLFPGLTSLPGAADEARRVAQVYPGSLLMTDEQATREALVRGLGKHSIVHLATHALVDDVSPSRSALALAARRPGDGTGALFADEIASLPFGRTRTLVLASCGSTAGPLAVAEGRLTLPRAFLSANVPTVVASLWPVSDQRSVELLAGLHTRLRAGDDPALALRRAQVRLLASRDARLRSPATWALFQALGG